MNSLKRLIPIAGAVVLVIAFASPSFAWMTGDANNDGGVDALDLDYLMAYVWQGGPPPVYLCSGDVNGDCDVNVGDIYQLHRYLQGLPGGSLEGCTDPPGSCYAGTPDDPAE